MEKLSRIVGLRMLAIKEGVECGKIREVVLDVEKKSVRYIVLDTNKGCFGLKLLENALVTSTGQDYATTATSETIINFWENEEAMKLAFTDADLIGARVVSNQGDVVGQIMDIVFDVKSGEIEKYILEGGEVLDKGAVVHIARGMVFVELDDVVESEPVPALKDVAPEAAPAPKAEVVAPPAAAPEVSEPVAEPALATPAPVEKEKEEKEEKPSAASLLAAAKNAASQKGAPETGDQASGQDMKSYFEKRRTEFLIGRTLKQDILGTDGSVLVAQGSAVTAETIELVKAADKLIELTMNVGDRKSVV